MDKQILLDYLADVLWWIKGYRAASKNDDEVCPLNEAHEQALRKARIFIDKNLEEGGRYDE